MPNRTAYVHVYDDNDATTSISYTVPEHAINESVAELLQIGLDAHLRVHGENVTRLSVSAQIVPEEEPKYRIILLLGEVPSEDFPDEYTFEEAEKIVSQGQGSYRAEEA